jgi:hypothetical protein
VADVTTTETVPVTTTLAETTTAPASTVLSTVEQTTTRRSQTAGSAILRRGPDLMVVSIDDKGLTNARPLASS